MIKIPTSIDDETMPAVLYLKEEVKRGIASHHIDGKYNIITFYYPEDESAFVLRFGETFLEYVESGFFYCPYIPVLHIDLKINI